MAGLPPLDRTRETVWRRPVTPLYALLVLPALACASGVAAAPAADGGDAAATTGSLGADSPSGTLAADSDAFEGVAFHPRTYGPPEQTPGVPSGAELEAAGAQVGRIVIDNQNIFNLGDPLDDTKLFRLADRLHIPTRDRVIRRQLLFKPGDRYSQRVIDESERILRADGYFYDAWIRPIAYKDGKVDLRVTTRDVWTINPGFNFGRSGGTNTTGAQLQDSNFLGYGASLTVFHTSSVDRTETGLSASDPHAFGSWISAAVTYGQLTDGYQHEITVQQPFYALETPWAAGVYGINDLQTDPLYDRGQIIDEFQDQHQGAQVYGGWSSGLQDGWVRRWNVGLTYDEHDFSPTSTWTGMTTLPDDRRFLYPWVEFDLVQDDFLRLWNHDQIARTEDFYLGTALTVRAGYADANLGSNQSAVIFQSNASTGFGGAGRYTLLLAGDFSGRISDDKLNNGLADGSVRYYLEQSKNWLFFTTLVGTKGWRLDLDDQILLGGDNGLRGYPLRYQDGTGRALWTVEQRYFTDWYPFRLFRVGGAVFFDTGRVWGTAPLAAPNMGLLKDVGFGLRFGNARSGLGNVVHVDLAFPLNVAPGISRVQFLVQTQQRF
jgi:Surface antigen variable number repeat